MPIERRIEFGCHDVKNVSDPCGIQLFYRTERINVACVVGVVRSDRLRLQPQVLFVCLFRAICVIASMFT